MQKPPNICGTDRPLTASARFPIWTRLSRLLSSRRITLQAALLAICLWSAYAVDLANPGMRDRAGNIKGADFLHFYIAGRLLHAGNVDALYDARAHALYQTSLYPASAGTYFVPMYGPQFYLLFEPLARLPYGWAAFTWAVLNFFFYFASCYAIWRTSQALRPKRKLILLLACAYPAFFSLIAFGQSSGPALVLFSVAFLCLRAGRPMLAGLAIGSLIYKPQLGLAAAVILLACGEGKIVAGAVAGAVAQLGFAWAWFGSEVLRRYTTSFTHLPDAQPFLEPKLYQMHSLRSFWMLLLPWSKAAFVLYVLSAVGVLILGIRCWRYGGDLRLRFSALLLCTVLVAPHLWIYDLVILAPALLLLGDFVAEQPAFIDRSKILILVYACYVLPLLGPLARVSRIQLAVISFAMLLWVLWSLTQSRPKPVLAAT